MEPCAQHTCARPTESDFTVIVTTSPVRSNPSTEMLASTLESLALVPYLRTAPKLLVCDGCIVKQKPQHKAGRVTADEQEQHAEFVRRVCASASSSGDLAFSGLVVLQLSTREGFGFAVRRALAEVTTPYVMINSWQGISIYPRDGSHAWRRDQESFSVT